MNSSRRGLLFHYAAIAWPWTARIITGAIVMVTAILIFRMGSRIDWGEVARATTRIDTSALIAASVLVCLGYMIYASLDYLSKRMVGHAMAGWKTLAVAATSYAINLNLGILLGGVGVRPRLYRRLGASHATAAQVVLFSSMANWLGYCWLAGIAFMAGGAPLSAAWAPSQAGTRLAGAALLATALAYLAVCAGARKRAWAWRSHRFVLPSLRMALVQNAVAIASWGAMGAIVYVLLERQIPYLEVLSILLFCSVAAIITHIPGGLGVTEAIFVAALTGRLPDHQVLAALLTYRTLYQLIPLCFAAAAYLAIELLAGKTPPDIRISCCGEDSP